MTPRVGILILDAERAVIEGASPFVTELLGCSREELLGRSFQDLCFLGDRAKGASLLEKVRRDGYVRCDGLSLRIRDDASVFVAFVGNTYLVNGRKVIQLDVRGVPERRGGGEAPLPEVPDLHPL